LKLYSEKLLCRGIDAGARSAALVLAGLMVLGLAAAARADDSDLAGLQPVIDRAVRMVSPAVVRVISTEATTAQLEAAAKADRARRLREQESDEAASSAGSAVRATGGKSKSAKIVASGAAEAKVKTHVRTGLVITTDGYVVTTLTNIGGQTLGIKVELPDGRVLPAKRLGEDRRRDLVLLKIEAGGLTAATAAPKADLRVGQWVLALGRTLPVAGPTVGKGILSGVGRLAGLAVQTDAEISPVNFGGPLVDLHGRVVGMIAATDLPGGSVAAGSSDRFSDSGIGFAVPLEDILAELPALAAGKHIEAPFLGIRFNMARLDKGATIIEVLAGTAAKASGLRAGDSINEFEHQAIESPFQLLYEIGSRRVGDKVVFKVLRDGKTIELHATLQARGSW
jgi:serine protease Do